MSTVLEEAINFLPSGRSGPSSKAPLFNCILWLGRCYYNLTGKMPAVSTDPIKASRGGPFVRFVIVFLKITRSDFLLSEQTIAEYIKSHKQDIRDFVLI